MIFIDNKMYSEIAHKLFSELNQGQGFFNGKIEHDTQELYSTLTCSLVVYRKENTPKNKTEKEIEKIIPVWWNFTTRAENTMEINDFSWSEFATFFPCHA